MSNYYKPKMSAKEKKELKCQYHECDVVYLGLPNSKYCDFHRQQENRKKPEEIPTESKEMFIFEHSFHETTEIERPCDLCKTPYPLIVYPNAKIYPKYCQEHRYEYKRELFIKRMADSGK